MSEEYIHQDKTYEILGACFEVYNEMGCGFLEHVYHECLEIEFADRQIPYLHEKPLQIQYKQRPLKKNYFADFLCYDCILIEAKAVSELLNEHRAQLINYLNATGLEVGLLVNFGHYPRLEYERIVNSRKGPPA